MIIANLKPKNLVKAFYKKHYNSKPLNTQKLAERRASCATTFIDLTSVPRKVLCQASKNEKLQRIKSQKTIFNPSSQYYSKISNILTAQKPKRYERKYDIITHKKMAKTFIGC